MRLDASQLAAPGRALSISPWDKAGSRSAPGRMLAGADFQSMMNSLGGSHGRVPHDTEDSHGREESVRQAAQQLVSSALLLPTLAMLRASGPTEGPFAPGDTERRFGPLLDQHLSDRIVASSNFSIVDAIVKRSMRTGSPAPAPLTRLTA